MDLFSSFVFEGFNEMHNSFNYTWNFFQNSPIRLWLFNLPKPLIGRLFPGRDSSGKPTGMRSFAEQTEDLQRIARPFA
jgi:hypothetical protein